MKVRVDTMARDLIVSPSYLYRLGRKGQLVIENGEINTSITINRMTLAVLWGTAPQRLVEREVRRRMGKYAPKNRAGKAPGVRQGNGEEDAGD